MQTYYNLYNSVFDEKDFKRITNPFKVEDGFPATPQDFNIIRPKIDLLIGEETKRPMNFRVVRTSQEAASELQDKEKEMLMQYLMAAAMVSKSVDVVAGARSCQATSRTSSQLPQGNWLCASL